MDDFDRYLNEQMKDPDFKKEWVENEARYQLTKRCMKIYVKSNSAIESAFP